MSITDETISDIVAYWLGPDLDGPEVAYARRDWWYKGPPSADTEIRSRFGDYVARACTGGLEGWRATPEGTFALILLLDQFTRNIYRNTPDAYLGDNRAFEIMREAMERGQDQDLHLVTRIWYYHPFHHAEDIVEQDRGIETLNALLAASPEPWHRYIRRSIKGWTRHRNIIARFGRFPHRNEVLGRENSDEERAFLNADGEAFGQGPKPG